MAHMLLALLPMAYLLGALPFSVWISRLFYQDDIRRHGSGNAGSTNMYRTYGLWAGLSTQLLDIAKGSLAAALPLLLAPGVPAWLGLQGLQLVLGLTAVLGHVYSVFIKFKGGKGVNTMLGMMLVVAPWGSLVAIGAFALMLLSTRMVSVGSMVGVLAFNTWLWLAQPAGPYLLHGVGAALFLFVVYTHRSNIVRIRQGSERRIQFSRKSGAARPGHG
ncbi:MAG: glycerol-3-phosphate 1-O-acyltransferase PlsY [Sphingobacteriia bacterium]|jgi:glycerol-3-phosphate acyltransferase PlsY